jgi:hypothetical protein
MAGADVVMPAAMVKPSGGLAAQRLASACSSRLLRSARSINPRSINKRGHPSITAWNRSIDWNQ